MFSALVKCSFCSAENGRFFPPPPSRLEWGTDSAVLCHVRRVGAGERKSPIHSHGFRGAKNERFHHHHPPDWCPEGRGKENPPFSSPLKSCGLDGPQKALQKWRVWGVGKIQGFTYRFFICKGGTESSWIKRPHPHPYPAGALPLHCICSWVRLARWTL